MNLIFLIEYNKSSGGMVKSTLKLIGWAVSLKYHVKVIVPMDREYDLPQGAEVIEVKRSWRFGRQSRITSILGGLEVLSKLFLCRRSILFFNNEDSLYSVGLLSKLLLNRHEHLYVNRGTSFTGKRILLLRMVLKFDDPIVATSTKTARDMMALGYRNLQVIGNSCKDYGYVKREYNGKLRIACLGYYNSNKNQKLILNLINEHPILSELFSFHMYGNIEESKEYYSEVLSMIDSYGLQNVFCHNYTTQLGTVFENADIVLSVSKSEGFGRTLIEGMSRGCIPIAFYYSGGPVDIIEPQKNGYLFRNIEDLKKILLEISCGDNLVDLSLQARKSFEENWRDLIIKERWRIFMNKL